MVTEDTGLQNNTLAMNKWKPGYVRLRTKVMSWLSVSLSIALLFAIWVMFLMYSLTGPLELVSDLAAGVSGVVIGL